MITAAAAVMIVVFAAFAVGGGDLLKLIGLALTSGILLDAFVIRTLLASGCARAAGPAHLRES